LTFNGNPLILDNVPNDFSLSLAPDATLENNTGLAPGLVFGLSALSASIDSITLGPLVKLPTNNFHPVTSISVYNQIFKADFKSQTLPHITV
jgi:hypothetical protein